MTSGDVIDLGGDSTTTTLLLHNPQRRLNIYPVPPDKCGSHPSSLKKLLCETETIK